MLPNANSCPWTQKCLGYLSQGRKVPKVTVSLAITSSILQFYLSFLYSKTLEPVICRFASRRNTTSYFLILCISSLVILIPSLQDCPCQSCWLCPGSKYALQLKRENAACNRLLMPHYDLYNSWASNNLEMKNGLSTLWCVETLFLPFILKPILFGWWRMLRTGLWVECLMGTVRGGAVVVTTLLGWHVSDQGDLQQVRLVTFQCISEVLIGNCCSVLHFQPKWKQNQSRLKLSCRFSLVHLRTFTSDRRRCECWIFPWKLLRLSSSLYGTSERIGSVLFSDCVTSWGQWIHKRSSPDLASDHN